MKLRVYAVIFALLVFPAPPEGTAQQAPDLDAKENSWVTSGRIYVAISLDRRSIYAYSTKTGMSSSIQFAEPLPAHVRPVLSSGLAAVQNGRRVHAISSHATGWDSVDLPADGMHVEVDSHAIRVSSADFLYLFGEGADAWSGIDLRTGRLLVSHGDEESP